MRSIVFMALCASMFVLTLGCAATLDDSKTEIGGASMSHLQATNGLGGRVTRDRVKIPVGAYGVGYGMMGANSAYPVPDQWQLATERQAWFGAQASTPTAAPQQSAVPLPDKEDLITCAQEIESGKFSKDCRDTFKAAGSNSRVTKDARKCFAALGAAKKRTANGKDTYEYASTSKCDALIAEMAKASAEAE